MDEMNGGGKQNKTKKFNCLQTQEMDGFHACETRWNQKKIYFRNLFFVFYEINFQNYN